MASTKGRILDRLGSWVLSTGTITEVTRYAERFVLLDVHSTAGGAYTPGDKVQIVLPSRDVRTYTPIGWVHHHTRLLVYLHGENTPATEWARAVAPGEELRFVGPQRSLSLPEGDVAIVGDETSIAVAAAYARAGVTVDARFELDPSLDVTDLLDTLGLGSATVLPPDSTEALVANLPSSTPVGLTGNGRLIQRARAALRTAGHPQLKPKTYWLEGKAGLD